MPMKDGMKYVTWMTCVSPVVMVSRSQESDRILLSAWRGIWNRIRGCQSSRVHARACLLRYDVLRYVI